MATKPQDRMVINPQERPLSTDINQLQSNVHLTRMQMLDWLTRVRLNTNLNTDSAVPTSVPLVPILNGPSPTAAFFGDSFFVSPNNPAGMSVLITPGLGMVNVPSDAPTNIGGLLGVDDIYPIKPLPIFGTQTIVVPAADPSQQRIDLIEVAATRRLEQPTSRDILNVVSGLVTPQSVNKVLAYYLDGQIGSVPTGQNSTAGISYKVGTPGGSVPPTTAGYVSIAEVYVAAAASTITQDKIVDRRYIALPGGAAPFNARVTLGHNGTNVTSLVTLARLPPGFRFATIVQGGLAANSIQFVLICGHAGFGSFPSVQAMITSPAQGGVTGAGFSTAGGGTDVTTRTSPWAVTTLGPTLAGELAAGGVRASPQILVHPFQIAWQSGTFTLNLGAGNYVYSVFGMIA